MRSWLIIAVLALTACGADGPPREPEVSGGTTIGVNSNTGLYADTEIGIRVGL